MASGTKSRKPRNRVRLERFAIRLGEGRRVLCLSRPLFQVAALRGGREHPTGIRRVGGLLSQLQLLISLN